MSRSEVLKFRCSPTEKATLEGQLKDGQNISELIRQRLGLVQLNGQADARTEVNHGTADNKRNCATLHSLSPAKPEKKRRGWGWLWWLLVAAVVLGAIWLVAQVQLYYWGV